MSMSPKAGDWVEWSRMVRGIKRTYAGILVAEHAYEAPFGRPELGLSIVSDAAFVDCFLTSPMRNSEPGGCEFHKKPRRLKPSIFRLSKMSEERKSQLGFDSIQKGSAA